MQNIGRHLPRLLVLFWACWSSLVFGSNLSDALIGLGVLPADFVFASGNRLSIVQVSAPFAVPTIVASLLFAGVVLWDAVNATLFWRAVGRPAYRDVAFVVAIALWAALMIADELFLTWRVAPFEETHRGIFTAMLVSYGVIYLVERSPDPRDVHD